MILTLIREQLRTQRSYIIWAAALIAATVAVVAFALGLGATEAEHSRYALVLQGGVAEKRLPVAVADPATNELPSDMWGTPITWDALRGILAQAHAEGVGADAVANTWLQLTPHSGETGVPGGPTAVVIGDFPWDRTLSRGRAPAHGEIVLAPWMAKELGADVGDMVGYSLADKPAGTLVVSGITYAAGGWSPNQWVPSAYLSGDDAQLAVDTAFAMRDPDPNEPWLQFAVNWDGPFAPLDDLSPTPNAGWNGSSFDSPSTLPWVLAAVLALGVAVMAFAAGRARAHERVRWSSTARALGVPRRTVALASLGEGLAVTIAAGVVGTAAGAAAAWAAHAIRQASTLDAPPIAYSFPAYAVLVSAMIAVLLGGVVAAVPAFLASRVSPAAALKDMAAIDEAESSRRVSVWPVTMLAATFYVFLLWSVGAVPTTTLASWTMGVTLVGIGVTGFALLVESSRGLSRLLGARLSRSDRPWALRAGIEMLAHPRQAGALITLHALAAGSMAVWAATGAANGGLFGDYGWFTYAPQHGPSRFALVAQGLLPWRLTLAVLVTAHLVGAATFAATRRLGDHDARVATALGLDARASLKATATRLAIPSFTGTVVGAVSASLLAGLPLIMDRTDLLTQITPAQRRFMAESLTLGTLAIIIIGAFLSALLALAMVPGWDLVRGRRSRRERALPVV